MLCQRSISNARSLFSESRDYDWNSTAFALQKRQDNGPIQCTSSTPCADGSCCNSLGKCGYSPSHCKPTAPVTCYSNCNAVAMCGQYSLGGTQKCGLDICCSYFGWCGTEELHCKNADPKGNTLPCQAGYGLCQVVPPPSCGTGNGTASGGRKIGYYQVSNIRGRACNKVVPDQLITNGFTQLNLAFASINPSTLEVIPWDPSDEPYYYSFTNLKSATLQTWISVGGFDFSDPGPTHTTWSDMVSSAANRQKFISSLLNFMARYKFQGADLNWEYPTATERGGRSTDPQNYVSLVREMRAAFGTNYGISLVLAPDYWYLRGMDPKSMEPYVDHFGFMSYDLHGSWDGNNPTLGPKIRPQTDIREIYNNTKPLWFAKLNPAKINFGIAYYGRGYTVADRSCMTLGCTFSGPNKAAPCTNFGGVMSAREIQDVINSKGVKPTLLSGPMIKELKWDDQWMGYDDDETINMKLGVANDLCLGGSMVCNPNIVTTGDSFVVVAAGSQLGSAGTTRQYQWRYYGVREGQTVDYSFLFEQDNSPLSVSKALPTGFDISSDKLPTDITYHRVFGRRCSYNPNSGSSGSLECWGKGSSPAPPATSVSSQTPTSSSSPTATIQCSKPSTSVMFCAPQNKNCGRVFSTPGCLIWEAWSFENCTNGRIASGREWLANHMVLPQDFYEASDQYYYFSLMSAAYAMQARGTVVVLTDDPRRITMTGIWGNVEFRILTNQGWTDRYGNTARNPNVDRIIATNEEETVTYVIFDRNDPSVTPNSPRRWDSPLPDVNGRTKRQACGTECQPDGILRWPVARSDPEMFTYGGKPYWFDFFG
ncbi:Glycoside hydrolase family 18 [Arthrobotrys flagrans]|uniref:chitinase n=1 Tax=Arthrobotrys flagrans TaxID=97331 RepID=A0A437AE98_ARTFL|nr:Glycoside hydrolase family 18 [Arthrobotrys flagrans]